MIRLGALTVVLVATALAAGSPAVAHQTKYCARPDNAGAFLTASSGVTCATARSVERRLVSSACYRATRCMADGFRCVSYWRGRFDLPFLTSHHALCNKAWAWIEWDGG